LHQRPPAAGTTPRSARPSAMSTCRSHEATRFSASTATAPGYRLAAQHLDKLSSTVQALNWGPGGSSRRTAAATRTFGHSTEHAALFEIRTRRLTNRALALIGPGLTLARRLRRRPFLPVCRPQVGESKP
jgi:hypothetical protein